ncbi:MAG TPA: methionyl-tRNA formyltransferase [Actinomycetota bacterium]|nr:methionyl-tRNA formyltransferase [Actinomycetota bacterium]
MKTVFFGTPQWAVPSFEALLASDIEVAAAVTNPDRPAGRGMEMRASPVKERALRAGLEVLQPQRARAPEFHASLEALAPDVATVVAYGKILPPSLLAIPRLGFVNLHFSLLPEYRGAAPVQRAVMDGRPTSGVSIMVLTEGMDEGPILSRTEEPVRADDTAGSLGHRLAEIGSSLLVDTLKVYSDGELEPVEQDHDRATYALKITTEEAAIDWRRPSEAIRNRVRGLNPVPGAWTTLRDKRLKVWSAERSAEGGLAPGELGVANGALVAGTGDGALELTRVQLQGKRPSLGVDAARGLRLARGERFE